MAQKEEEDAVEEKEVVLEARRGYKILTDCYSELLIYLVIDLLILYIITN